jgi:Tol biopolymer transport system component
MALAPGTRLGPYEIAVSIGVGGMGEVYKATDTRLDRTVAIKVLPEHVAADADLKQRFEREAKTLAAVSHPHICPVFDVGSQNGVAYLVMEYLEGETLAVRLSRGRMPLETVLRFGAQIADALSAAHARGIIHRDLKPSNIMIAKTGVKVLDFGVARVIQPMDGAVTSVSTVTVHREIVGSLPYMAPEQLKGKDCDARSDIYALGLVIHEMATGKRVAHERTHIESPLLEQVVSACLEPDPEDRWQSATDVKRALALALPTTSAPTSSRLLTTIAVLTVVGFTGWTVEYFRGGPSVEPVRRLQITPPPGGHFAITGNAAVGGMTISPDGTTAAFVATVGEHTGLWVQPLNGTARFLTGTDSAAYPFWSPDSTSIAFIAKGQLQRVNAAGGSPLTVASVGTPLGGTWLPDGRIVLGADTSSTTTSGLSVVSEVGGHVTPLTEPDGSEGHVVHTFPQWIPGNRILYHAQSTNTAMTGIFVTSLIRPSERVRLLTTEINAVYASGRLLWWSAGTLFAQDLDLSALRLSGEPQAIAEGVTLHSPAPKMNAAVSENGLLLYDASGSKRQLSWTDASGKSFASPVDLPAIGNFRIAPDSRRLAVMTGSVSTGGAIWILDQDGRQVRVISSRELYLSPTWSPDGLTIVFSKVSATGGQGIFRIAANGSGAAMRLGESRGFQPVTDWSRDGRSILYYEVAAGTQRDLWTLPVTAEGQARGEPQSYLRTPANESWGRFSPEPNPRWVAYQSDATGRFEVYIQSFPVPGGQVRISTAGGSYPQWSPDGRELYYLSDNKLVAATLNVSDDSIKVVSRRELFPVSNRDSGAGSPSFDLAPDGRGFVIRAEVQSTEALTVVTNWTSLLKTGKAGK